MIRILTVSLLLLMAVPSPAKSRPATPPVDREYAAALATADRFLQAWQTQDEESGIFMLTDRIRQHTGESELHKFFASGFHQGASFEIGHGKKLAHGRYEFPVSLFPGEHAAARRRTHRQATALIVVRAGKDDWAIDRLP